MFHLFVSMEFSQFLPLYTYWSGKHFHISQMTYNFIIAFSFAIVYMCIFTNSFFLSFLTTKERKKKPLCGIPQDLHWSNVCMYFKLKCEIRKRVLKIYSKATLPQAIYAFTAMCCSLNLEYYQCNYFALYLIHLSIGCRIKALTKSINR